MTVKCNSCPHYDPATQPGGEGAGYCTFNPPTVVLAGLQQGTLAGQPPRPVTLNLRPQVRGAVDTCGQHPARFGFATELDDVSTGSLAAALAVRTAAEPWSGAREPVDETSSLGNAPPVRKDIGRLVPRMAPVKQEGGLHEDCPARQPGEPHIWGVQTTRRGSMEESKAVCLHCSKIS